MTPGEKVRAEALRFTDSDGCWVWRMSKNPTTGYGHFRCGGRLYTAHRASFSEFVGPIPEGMHVLHRCDNRPCFNPKHLFLGTHSDNMRDMISKGRQGTRRAEIHWTAVHPEKVRRGVDHHLHKDASCLPRGVTHHNAKLTECDVRDIRESTETLATLSTRYGLSQSSLSSIRLRKTWRHVD